MALERKYISVRMSKECYDKVKELRAKEPTDWIKHMSISDYISFAIERES